MPETIGIPSREQPRCVAGDAYLCRCLSRLATARSTSPTRESSLPVRRSCCLSRVPRTATTCNPCIERCRGECTASHCTDASGREQDAFIDSYLYMRLEKFEGIFSVSLAIETQLFSGSCRRCLWTCDDDSSRSRRCTAWKVWISLLEFCWDSRDPRPV